MSECKYCQVYVEAFFDGNVMTWAFCHKTCATNCPWQRLEIICYTKGKCNRSIFMIPKLDKQAQNGKGASRTR